MKEKKLTKEKYIAAIEKTLLLYTEARMKERELQLLRDLAHEKYSAAEHAWNAAMHRAYEAKVNLDRAILRMEATA